MLTPGKLQTLYKQGKNITQLLREEQGIDHNTNEIIEIAYDLQTGSYLEALKDKNFEKLKSDYSSELAKIILSLCKPISILEAGVGEGTTLSGVISALKKEADFKSYGFDLSWSRVAYAKRWLESKNISDVTLCTGNLLNIPFSDNSIDLVYTSHSVEPNGGKEKPILEELYRVARKYLVLLEPGYEFANEGGRQRMDMHGYCKNIKGISEFLGYNILKHEIFPYTSNPLNPTVITIIENIDSKGAADDILACPRFKTRLEEIDGMLFSPEALVIYPVLANIPCLKVENGILASKYKEFIAAG